MSKKNAQPAKKSYFFGQGYKDIGDAIRLSWRKNASTAKKYYDSFTEKGLMSFKGIFKLFCALSVVSFGTVFFALISLVMVAVVSLFFVLVYIGFSAVWLFDRLYLMRKKIFTACNECKSKFLIPTYLCPDCGAQHTNLTPGMYGILRRTCSCGRKLPTAFFNGRKKLQAICPNCLQRGRTTYLNDRESRPLCIPVVGGRSVGKTAYITAFAKRFIEFVAPQKGLEIEFYNQAKEDIYGEIKADFAHGSTRMTARPQDLSQTSSVSLSFFIKHKSLQPERLVHIYDTPDDLHMSKAGNQLMFWYTVQKVDGAAVTITSLTGITDIFGNAAEINGETAAGATLESARMRDAATGLSAAYENGQATVTVTLSEEEAYKNKCASYHTPSGDEAKEVPFQAVVTDGNGKVTEIQQVYVEGTIFSTQPFAVAAQNAEMTYTVTLQANEGTWEDPNWVDLSYNKDLQDSFSVSALVQAATVTVTDDSEGDYELSLADAVRPTLTAKVYGPDGSTLASSQSGTWSSSDTDIATITTEDDYSGKVALTGRKVGEVTFTFTADNGTPEDDSDDKTGKSQTYTVVAGESIALVIPEGASTIVVRQKAAATVLWSSNAAILEDVADFQYTIEVFQGNHTDEATLTGEPVYETTTGKDKNSVLIPENVLNGLSDGDIPAYTVRVSMPHPNGSGAGVRLSALAWIVVHPEPATAVLTRPESLYLKDDEGPVEIGWSLENYTSQIATFTILRVTEDSTFETVYEGPLSDGSGTYTLNLSQVEEGNFKDTYQVMLSVDNGQYESPSTDSFPLYVYNADALQIVNSEDKPITELTLDNTSKVDGDLPTDTQEILSMRQELGLLDYIGINYGDYDWNSFKDGIAWATTNEKISVNYKQGGLYEDIQLFDFDTYLPELKMGIATVEGGEAIITATHAATGMKDTISVTADTLQDQFYLFQVTPAVKTTLRYTNGDDEERTVTTNSEGVLALYEPSGIASDVWLNSEVTEDGETTEYLGTIYNYDLQSGEGDARKLQLYPLNTFRLREAAKAELTLVKPDGSPLADSEVIVRGGVYKNGYFCETAGLGIDREHIGHAGEEQQDTKFTTDENGKLTVYFDFTQFWSEEAGETKDSLPTAEDKIQYVLEVRDIENNTYYPLFQMVDGTVSPMQEMRTASGVVVLEKVPQGEANKPFVARQVIDYHLEDGALIDTRYSTGFVGPNYNFQEAVLTTDMLLWGESGDGASYSLTMVDENDYSPEAQVPTGAERYNGMPPPTTISAPPPLRAWKPS